MNLGVLAKDMIRRGPASDPDGGALTLNCYTPAGAMRPELAWTRDGTLLYRIETARQTLLDGFVAVDLLMQGWDVQDVVREGKRWRKIYPWEEPRLRVYQPYGFVDWSDNSEA